MINEETLEKLSERLVNRIEELNLFMIKKMGKQILNIGKMTPSQLRQVFQSIEFGASLDEIVQKVAEITNKSVVDIYEIFEEVAKKSQYNAKKFYEYENVKFIPYDDNKTLQNQVKALAKATTKEFLNISKTMSYTVYNQKGVKEFTNLSEIYQKITDKAILSAVQGRESYEMAMRQAMKELTFNGLRTVDYASGYSRRMDSSVRLNIMDGIRRLSNELQEEFGKEFGADGIEISHHKNAAPDHIDTLDGKQFSLKGKITIDNVTYEDFDVINNSLKRHLGELNCYHFPMSIILEISKPLYTKEELELDKQANIEGFEFDGKHYTNYEGTQLQRRLETKIRQYKDRQIGARTINNMNDVYYCQDKIQQLTQKYSDLSKISGLPTKIERLRVDGYKRSSKKESTIPKYTMENNRIYMSNYELEKHFNNMNSIIKKHTNNNSKWSEKLVINNEENSGKLWNCDIRIQNNTTKQEISHELLHSYSISHFNEKIYEKYIYEEEATVELFNKYILLKENIPYYDNGYSNMVSNLEKISDIMGLDRYEFAKNLFEKKVTERELYLKNMFKDKSNMKELNELLKEAFVKWNM